MASLTATLDVSQLLVDLKRCSELTRRFTGWLDADKIAACVTAGLVEMFPCAFARIWLVEPDSSALRLVASSGLYTRLDGSFARVPMGAFKVGKIAQNCIPFLSNRLADESWVKDRNWAINNQIQGFAGLPLMVSKRAIGVLAVFSHDPMAAEFLEVLQILSLSVTGALAAAMHHHAIAAQSPSVPLSEHLAAVLGRSTLSLLGTEQPLPDPVARLLLQTARQLAAHACQYCRLVYDSDSVTLEAVLPAGQSLPNGFDLLEQTAARLGGEWQYRDSPSVQQIRLRLPQQVLVLGSSPLSEREQDVLQLMAVGLRDRDIAARLFISDRTVKFHAKNILAKLSAKTRVQAAFEATRQGWLTDGHRG